MTYALNEVEMLVRKAALGAGLDPGRASELAAAGLWLARRRFAVCDIVHAALAGDGGAPLEIAPDGAMAECATASAAHVGPAVFDLLLVKPSGFRVSLRDLDEPRLIVALAAVAALRHAERFVLNWEGGVLSIGPGRSPETSLPGGPSSCPAGPSFAAGPVRRLEIVRATPSEPRPPFVPEARAMRYDPTATGDRGWAALEDLARRTCVPASETSRRTGAGAGLTDND